MIDSATAGICLAAIKETGNVEGVVDFLKGGEEEGGPSPAQRLWFETNVGKSVSVKGTDHIGVVHRLNEATRGLYPGSRYPIYVKMTEGSSVGAVFEYDVDWLVLLEGVE